MKTRLVLFGAALLVAGSLWAGPDVIIRERAKELRNQNNVRQGVAPPTQSPLPATAPAAAAPAQSGATVRLQTDLAAIRPGSQPTAAQKQRLTQDVLAIAQGAKPSLATATKLGDDLATACAQKSLSQSSRARLAMEMDAVLNPGKYPSAKPEGIFADIQAIFQERADNPMGSEARKQAVAIADDVRAAAHEVQNGGIR